MNIRPAKTADFPALMAMWNPIIRNTIVTFSDEEKTAESLGRMIDDRRSAGQDFWLAEDQGNLLGLVTYGQFRGGNGYAFAMEHTIILAETARGRGVGRALMKVAEDHARSKRYHTMIAGVSAENGVGIAFHTALGYREVARVPEVGRKFGRWHDLVILQKLL